MLTGIKKYILANVESVQNAENGDRTKRVTDAKVLAKTVELVGIQTGSSVRYRALRFLSALRSRASCIRRKNICI